MVERDDSETQPVGRRFRQWAPPDLPWLRRRIVPPPDVTVEEIASRDIAEQEIFEEAIEEVELRTVADWELRFRAWRLAGLGLLLVLVLVVTMSRLLVGGPPSVAELRAEAGVDEWTTLNIGVKDDQYGVAYYDPADGGKWSGFDIEIAYMIAEDLGFRRADVRFYGLESEDRARMQATDPKGNRVAVQLVIASYSVTDKRKSEGVHFSAPYLFTEQSVITLNDHDPVSALEDLKDQRVCTLSTSTSQNALQDAEAVVSRKNRVRECFAELDAGKIDAVSTDAAILAGWKDRFPEKYQHWDLGLESIERWGVNVGDNPALEKLVNLTLYRSYADPKDSRWERAFQENLQAEIDRDKKTPIADGQQPRVERPDVRHLPWEDPLG
ncbi:transporter substrate-binding domain-containing protein [Actinoplanes sp. NPDC023936]|uniref:transporter substrate-binding domain-containing protein n=1 Tax=Actinoplanes sp. NPDC023936 TaxID=3154910 RepID=UPI0033F6901B